MTTSAKKPPSVGKNLSDDPLDVVPRMYQQVARLLGQLEQQDIVINAKEEDGVTIPQRISALIAAGRIMKMMQDIRRGSLNADAGSAIDKYAAAFQTPNATGGREPRPRPNSAIEFDEPEPGDPDYDNAA